MFNKKKKAPKQPKAQKASKNKRNKKQQSIQLPFSDDIFLKVELDKENAQHKDIVEIILGLDRDFEAQGLPTIASSDPFVNFYQFEQLSQRLKAQALFSGEAYVLKSVETMERDANGQPDDENNVKMSYLRIDGDFQNITKTIVDTMFTSAKYDQFSYADKKEYIIAILYWFQLANKVSGNAVARIPSEKEIEREYINSDVPDYDNESIKPMNYLRNGDNQKAIEARKKFEALKTRVVETAVKDYHAELQHLKALEEATEEHFELLKEKFRTRAILDFHKGISGGDDAI